MSEHNSKGEQYTFTLDHNKFSTFTDDEFNKYLGLAPDLNKFLNGREYLTFD